MRLTPKEKAKELVYKFMDTGICWKQSKQCALIAVDELIKVTDSYQEEQYLLQVIEEIENLKNETK